MSEAAFKTHYRETAIDGFEIMASLLRETVTYEAVINGNTATFLVADSGGATATNRGLNGDIVYRADDNEQLSATLYNWNDGVEKNNFNIFASQGNQIQIMQRTTMGTINRKIDLDIITQLDTATIKSNATGIKATVKQIMHAQTLLTNAAVPWDSNVTLLCTAAMLSYLKMAPEFSKATYVDVKPFAAGQPNWRDKPPAYRWDNMLVIVHPNLTGVATSSEKCYLYHKNAIGHACDVKNMDVAIGYEEKHARSWARVGINMGSKKLQNSGIIQMLHDGSEFVAA